VEDVMHRSATTRDLYGIDWADVAARARADLGDERVARVSERLRTTMLVRERSARAGSKGRFRIHVTPPTGEERATITGERTTA
jgi:hypothetical protein